MKLFSKVLVATLALSAIVPAAIAAPTKPTTAPAPKMAAAKMTTKKTVKPAAKKVAKKTVKPAAKKVTKITKIAKPAPKMAPAAHKM
jgi:hypothetical protein